MFYSSDGYIYNKGQVIESGREISMPELMLTGSSSSWGEQIYNHHSDYMNNLKEYDWDRAVDAMNVLAIGNEVKTQIMEYTVRNNYKSARTWWQFEKLRDTQKQWRAINTLGKVGANYLKYAKALGGGVAIASTMYSAIKMGSYYYNGGKDWRVGAKFGVDLLMTGVGAVGPIGFGLSVVYFGLDKYTNGFGTEE